ncbi:RagB/SusD family nutrient uptake outer membrane protein [Zhouia sp. PK063]|uniref:RagB/SusD family nutrient uptake outer membrane protein n=1 Tax=Zhouia sp. PK063 TaxID=3373602 RepID=UPI0037A2AAAA
MKKIKYLYITIFLTGLYSCNLDRLPTGEIVAENAITDENTAENALNGVYYQFAGGGIDYYDNDNISWTYNNEIFPAQITGNIYYANGGLGSGLNLNVVTYSDSYIANLWESRYKIATAASGVIDGVESLKDVEFSDNRKAEIVGEAKFLRAYANFSLLSYFGYYKDVSSSYGIILRNTLTKATDIVKPRSSVQDCYDIILSDLDDAIQNAPNTNEAYYTTSWAAKLLKARVLLFKGEYAESHTLAVDVIHNGPYQLDDMKALFTEHGLESSEVILGLMPGINQVDHYNTYISYRNTKPGYLPTENLQTLLSNDPRGSWMLNTEPNSGEIILSKYQGSVQEYSYALRLTEAYLIAAETDVKTGNESSAKTYLEAVEAKAGVSDFSEIEAASGNDLLFEIYKEYQRNMCIEDGQTWFALTRLPFTKIQELRPGIQEKKQLTMPIPEMEIIRNSAIIQNPGYEDQ